MHLNLNMFPTVAPNGISVIASVSIPQLQVQFTIDKTTNVALYLSQGHLSRMIKFLLFFLEVYSILYKQ